MTGRLTLLRGALFVAIAVCAALDLDRARRSMPPRAYARRALAAWSLIMVGFVCALWIDHIGFPLQLDLMEGTILQHVNQAAHGLPVYPYPTPEFVPLAYNPLYYYLCVPFTWVAGINFPTLRFVAILGMAGCGAVTYAAVRHWTGSRWWGLIALGLFATAYRVMDAYLDTAHSDSWLLFSILLGTYLIDRAPSRAGRIAGVVALVLAFWFKQHGALFAIGGLAYLTWREGWKASVPYWLMAVALGPVAYLAAARWPFGPAFHYFTWEVPRGWSRVNRETFARVARFASNNYLPLLVAACIPMVRAWRGAERVRVWHIQFICAIASAFMGSLDWGSSDNVFIPFGALAIVLGTVGLAEAVKSAASATARAAQAMAVVVAFLPLTYAPQTVILSPRASAAYADFLSVVHGLDGPLYAPGIGELAGPPLFYPGAHWVALEDMERGPGHTDQDHRRAYALLDPVRHPRGSAYVLTNSPLAGGQSPVSLLVNEYVLATDFGDRFAALRGLPKRYDHKFPRYLYRYAGVPSPAAGTPMAAKAAPASRTVP